MLLFCDVYPDNSLYKSNLQVQYLENSNMYKVWILLVLVVVASVRSDNHYLNDCLNPGTAP